MEARSLVDFILLYQQFAFAENLSPRTIETTGHAVRLFDRFLGGCKNIAQLDAANLRQYIWYLQAKSRWDDHPLIKAGHGALSPFTVACYIRSIKSFWAWLLREEFIPHNPFERVKVPAVPIQVVKPFSPDQIEKILDQIPKKSSKGFRDSTVIVLLYGLGVRISEALNLKMSDINFENRQIIVRGKGNRERVLFMSPKVYKAMYKYFQRWRPGNSSEYFFVSDNGMSITRFYFEHIFGKYVRKAGIDLPKHGPHILRHAFSIEYLRGGGDENSLQRILGHSTVAMTRHYARLAETDIEIKLRMFSPIEKLKIRI